MRILKAKYPKWTRVRSGTWTWQGYTAERVWVYAGRQSTHYYVWVLSFVGTYIGEYAILAKAKQVAAQHNLKP